MHDGKLHVNESFWYIAPGLRVLSDVMWANRIWHWIYVLCTISSAEFYISWKTVKYISTFTEVVFAVTLITQQKSRISISEKL